MTTKRPAPNPDSLRDEHLLAALHHVPDHDENAPADLGARIRAVAHRAVSEHAAGSQSTHRPDPAPSLNPGVTPTTGLKARWARWFGSPYAFASAGTAMAGLLVATMLWVGREEWPQHAQDHGSTPAPQAEFKQPADVPASASTLMSGRARSGQTALSRSPASEAPRVARSDQGDSTEKSSAAPAPDALLKGRAREPGATAEKNYSGSPIPSSQLRVLISKPAPADTASTVESSASSTVLAPGAAPATAPSVMAAAAPPAVPPPLPPLAANEAAPRSATSTRRVDATPAERATAAAPVARSAGSLALSIAPPEGPTRAPSTGAWLRLAAARATHWQLGEGTSQAWRQTPHGKWLNSVALATGQADREAPGEAPTGVLYNGQISRDGRAIGRLWFAESLLRWCDEQHKCREADVEPARMRELLATLPR